MLELRALGGLTLQGADPPLQPKRLALLTYLALARPCDFHRRDTLLALFWPELDDAHARPALRQALTALRSLDESLVLTRGDEEVAAAKGSFAGDVLSFEAALERGELERALEVYTGPFLDGFFLTECPEFEHWVEAERMRLQSLAAEAAWTLADGELVQNPAGAVRWARLAAEYQRDDEAAVRRLIEVLGRVGDRAGALREYERFAARLREEYQAEPAAETRALVSAVREGQAPNSPGPESQAIPFPTRPVDTPAPRPGHLVPASVLAIAAVILVVVVGGYLVMRRGTEAKVATSAVPRLAVLPFENLGAAEDEYFADGVTDEIMTKLAGLKGLAVVSAQSAMQFKGTAETTEQIGRKLGVQYLLQGRIQWQRLPDGSSRVRVMTRLIRVADDSHLWASDFDAVLQDVFRLESDVATQVTSALSVALVRREREAVDRRPTNNLRAYEHYLRGNAFFRAGFPYRPAIRDAAVAYEKAVALDPGLAAAFARLSMVYGGFRRGILDPDRNEEFLAKQKQYAESALALDPGLPEGHLAMGWYRYWGHYDYERALREVGIALAAEPNNSFFIESEGAIYKAMGDYVRAAERFGRASDLDPLSPSAAAEAGYPNIFLRRYAEGERYLERFAAITGEYDRLAYLRLARDGDPAALRAWLDRTLGPEGFLPFIAAAAHGGASNFGRPVARALCGGCDGAIPLVPSRRERDWQRYYGIALLHERAGRTDHARRYYDSSLVRRPPYPDALAKVGRRDEGVRAATRSLERARRDRDVLDEANAIQSLAEVYVIVGEYDAALKQLEWLLSHPSPLSVGLLRADPQWDPLRHNARFQALLAKYQN